MDACVVLAGIGATAVMAGGIAALLDRFWGDRTIVAMRSMKTPASHWDERVYYDVWGSPYVKTYGSHHTSCGSTALLPGGETSATYIYGTEWRHKSGPQIIFPNKPERPFP